MKYIFLIFLAVFSSILFSAVKPEIQTIIDAYDKGDLKQCTTLLQTVQATTQEERPIIIYYGALVTHNSDAAKTGFLSLTTEFPKSQYAQKALIELGNMALLDRDYDKALGYYKSITDPNMPEKHYWIANTYYQMCAYQEAITSGNQYIRLAKYNPMVEDVYYLVADAYFSLFQYNNTINTLKKLISLGLPLDDEQYLRYRYGYAAEKLGNKQEALSQYKQGIEKDRFSSLAYLIEDRLFDMRSKYGSTLDLSFLYPFSDSPLPDIVIEEQMKAELEAEQANQDSSAVVKETKPTRLEAVPDKGLYLQAGRFSQEKNAVKLCEQVIKLKLNAQYYQSTQFKDVSWVVVIGPYQSQEEAQEAKDTLKDNLIDSFIIER